MKGGTGADSAKLQAAQNACQKYMQMGGGRAPSPAEQAKVQNAMLDYARCMRAHGVDMPDPKFSGAGGGPTFQFGGPGKKGGSTGPNPAPAFKQADRACHGKLADLRRAAPAAARRCRAAGAASDERRRPSPRPPPRRPGPARRSRRARGGGRRLARPAPGRRRARPRPPTRRSRSAPPRSSAATSSPARTSTGRSASPARARRRRPPPARSPACATRATSSRAGAR